MHSSYFVLKNKEGKQAEQIVKDYLTGRGYTVQDVSEEQDNYQNDIDFIVQKDGRTSKIEVKLDTRLAKTQNIAFEDVFFFDPSSLAVGWGQPLHGVIRQQQYHSQSDKQSEQETLHGLPSFLGLRRAERRLRTKKSNRANCKYAMSMFPATGIAGTVFPER